MSKSRSVIDGPFSPLMLDTARTAAWQAMSATARVIYVTCLRARFRGDYAQNNNGKIYPSSRQIAAETGFNQKTAVRGLREIEHYGFAIETNPASLGVDGKGKAAHLRLTELPYMGEAPTRDYLSWDGTLFDDGRKKNRPRKNKIPIHQTDHPDPPNGSPYDPQNGSYVAQTPETSAPAPICEQDHPLNDNFDIPNPDPQNGSYLDGSPSSPCNDGVEEWQRNAKTPDERLPDDAMDLPTFLRRGHADCMGVKE
jgi:hypothetical protein